MNWTEEQLREHYEELKLVDRWAKENFPPDVFGSSNGSQTATQAALSPVKVTKGPNKTEAAFAAHLENQKKLGLIQNWWFESVRLKVGEDCWWKMDFLVQNQDGSYVIYDTKGTKRLKNGKTKPYAEEDAIVKARSIAAQFPFPVFFVWREKNGEWSERRM